MKKLLILALLMSAGISQASTVQMMQAVARKMVAVVTTTTVAPTTTTTTTAAGNNYEIEYLFAADWSGASSNEAVNTGGGGFNTNGLTGAGAAQPTWVDTDGTNSAYADFDGGDYIDTRGGSLIESAAFTVGLWFRPDGAMGNLDGLISKAPAGPWSFSLRFVNTTGLEFMMTQNLLKSGYVPTADEWQHVVVVFDDAVGRSIYVDAVLQTNDSYTTQLSSDAATLSVGFDYVTGAGRNFNGDIDGVIVDIAAWTPATITNVYQAGTNDHVNP